jgi:hypothetical protein
LDHRSDALVEDVGIEIVRVAHRVSVVPPPVLLLPQEVDRIREGRHPSPVDLYGVPTAVIMVEMGAEHDVYYFGEGVQVGQIVQVRGVKVVEIGSPAFPAVARAGIDHDG